MIQTTPRADTLTHVRAPLPVRTGFRLLSGLSEGLAARAAEELFCTPRRHPRSAEEARLLGDAQPFPVRLGLRELRGWRWGLGPAILLTHGWEGRGSQLAPFVSAILEAGYSAVTWDAPGHGDSPGRRSSLVEFADAIWAAGRAAGEVHGLIAHSMGAAAAGLALQEGLPIERAVFVAPPLDLATYSQKFSDLLALPAGVHERMLRAMERRYHVGLGQLSFESIRPPEDVPLLVVHDHEDKETPFAFGEKVAKEWPGAELYATTGLGHRRILSDPSVIRKVARFLG
ncbi:MAG: alpha/beta hydrolase [Planctomycetes bacterium]|nr:alpha/beta hydrolase [Planctomycetota bacterium]